MTRAELKLYHYIAQMPAPYVVYPQVPVGHSWTLDFYCPQARLAIEVDGPEHDRHPNQERDRWRDHWFAQRGIATFRVTNTQVHQHPVDAAEREFKRICKRERILVHTNPESPYYGWRPSPPLLPSRAEQARPS